MRKSRALLQRASINGFVYSDDQGRVLGFGGLAAAPMHHRFEVYGHPINVVRLGQPVHSRNSGTPGACHIADPESSEVVRLVVTPDWIETVEPDGAVISFNAPDAPVFGTSATNVMAKFCHFIFFFASRSSGERWVAKHPGTAEQ
jgi:hypothetical protein